LINDILSNNQQKPIDLGAPGSDIGKRELISISRRFQYLHQQRLQRIQQFLLPHQRLFLELLPLLFHSNYPALPGFVSSSTPFGIPNYLPSKRSLGYAKKLSTSFSFKKRALKSYSIDAIFLMGSAGSVAYSTSSDLDIWLCHRSDLDSNEIEELQQKASSVEQWGVTLGLEVHFFLINTEGFRRGEGCPISTENCGSIQHHLLLEEFYRTGLYIAGKIPVWWLVPSHQEQSYNDYVTHLKNKRFIQNIATLDFGGLETIPPEEFIGASLWHLYKAINSPYKSLIKLLLMEAYASTFPDTIWVSLTLKRAIYEGNTNLDQLDSYILMYQKVEEYLSARGETDRLNLIRYCFYQKVHELNNTNQTLSMNSSRDFLESMASKWDSSRLQRAHESKHWNIHDTLEEYKLVTEELINSYRLLNQFAGRFANDQNPENDELKLLGRKLYSVFERKPGKIDVIYTGLDVRLHQEQLVIQEVQFADDEQGWVLFTNAPGSDLSASQTPIKKSRSLLELLTWISVNGLYNASTRIRLETESSNVKKSEIRLIHDSISKFLKQKRPDSDQLEIYTSSPDLHATALFINIGDDPMSTRKDGLQTASNRGDALSFGSMRSILIRSIDQVVLTTWQEILIYRHLELKGLLDCFCDILNQSGKSIDKISFECFCFASTRSQPIASRIKETFEQIRSIFADQSTSTSSRFILRGGRAFYIFSRTDSVVQYWHVVDETHLLTELTSPQPHFSSVVFDHEAVTTSPIPYIYELNKPGVVQVFCTTIPKKTDIYILDERGSLYCQQREYTSVQILLEPYNLFLESVFRRYAFLADITIEYYSLDQQTLDDFLIEPIQFKTKVGHQSINIRVSADELALNETAYTIYCNDKEFSSMEYGDALFRQVAHHIFQIRQSGKRYPICVDAIDVPLKILGIDVVSQLQTIHLLQYRQKIEQRLDQAN